METFVQNIYIKFKRNSFRATAFTPEKHAHAFSGLWSLLISAGIKFERNDLKDLYTWSEGGGHHHSFCEPREGHYSLAVSESNMSFVHAYEEYIGRKPFITKGIDYNRYSAGGYICHGSGKTQGRLVIGASFCWKGRKVTVTSFRDDIHSLIACEYQPEKEGAHYERAKIKKRFTISVEDLRKARKPDPAASERSK